MHHKLTAVYVAGQMGDVVAFVEEMPGLHAQGATIEEARKNLHDAAELLFAAYRQENRETFTYAQVLHREVF